MGELSVLSVDLRDAMLGLRPSFERRDKTKSEDEIKSERLQNYYGSWLKLYAVTEQQRPFYSNDVYLIIRKIKELGHAEAVEYRYGVPAGDSSHKYWKSADKNKAEMER